MSEKNRRALPVIQGNVVNGVTCFSLQAKYNTDCQRKTCRQWLSNPSSHNCVLIAAQDGPRTLQEIGQMYGLTRMRICQIEKGAYVKIKKLLG